MEEDAEKNQKDNAKQVKETLYKTEVIAQTFPGNDIQVELAKEQHILNVYYVSSS